MPQKANRAERKLKALAKKVEDREIARTKEIVAERRGGARVGAGRKPGSRSIAKRLISIREITDEIIRGGKVPLRTMIKHMVHYDEVVTQFEEQLENALAEHQKQFTEDGLIHILEIMEKMGDARMKAVSIAAQAAPYLHPRLSAITYTNTNKPPVDMPDNATDEELEASFRELRSQDYIPPVIIDNDEAMLVNDENET